MQAVSRGFLGACASCNKSFARIYGKGMDCFATDSCQWDFWPWNKHGSRTKAQKEMLISCQSTCLFSVWLFVWVSVCLFVFWDFSVAFFLAAPVWILKIW